MKLVTKWCKGCGKIMRDVNPCKRYCDKCLHDKNLRYAQISYLRQKVRKEEKEREERAASLPRRPRLCPAAQREQDRGLDRKEVIPMPKIMIPDILSLIISVFIHTVLLFVAYRAGHNDGYREGYLDDKVFEKTVQDTFRHVQPIQMDHTHGG